MKIFIEGELDNFKSVGPVVRQLLESPDEVVIVYINSDGGDALAGFALYSALKYSGKTVITHAMNLVYSSAMLPYLAGSIRFAHPYAHFLIHEVRVVEGGEDSEEEHRTSKFYLRQHDTLNKDNNILLNAIAKNSKLKVPRMLKEIKNSPDHDWHFYAHDALKFGIVHQMGFPRDEKDFVQKDLSLVESLERARKKKG